MSLSWTATYELSKRTTYVYDALNRMRSEIDPLGGRTTVAFDANDNRTLVQDPLGNRTTTTFDALNRAVDVQDPLGNSATYVYDAASQLTSTTDRLGRRRDFAYDDVGQNLTEKWYTSGALQQTQTFSYDAVGSLLTAVDPDGAYWFTYDALQRIKTVLEPFSLGLTFTYDASDNRTVIEDSKGGLTTMGYDAANRRTDTQFTGNGATLRFDFAYDARDSLTKITRYQQLNATGTVGWTSFAYDSRGRMTNQQHRDSSNTSLLNTTFAYDNFDRHTVRTIDGVATTYSYDDTNQLTGDGTSNYAYDANGNRTGGGYATGTGNRTTNDGTWTYSYDAEGNRTKRSKGASLETWTYGYDHRNQLVWVEKRATDSGSLQLRVDYKYDAFNRRIERLADSDGNSTIDVTERFGYDGAHVWVDLDGSNNLQHRRLYGVGIDTPIVRISSLSAVVWYLTDYQNSIVGQLNSNGGLIGKATYDGFGNELTNTFGASADQYGYTARERDALTQLQYNHNRWYDAALGKWLTLDPIAFSAGDANLYRYVGNGATNGVDPSGLIDEDRSAPKLNQAVALRPGPVILPNPRPPIGSPPARPVWWRPSWGPRPNGKPSVVFAGHGTWLVENGFTIVPTGTTLTLFVQTGHGLRRYPKTG